LKQKKPDFHLLHIKKGKKKHMRADKKKIFSFVF